MPTPSKPNIKPELKYIFEFEFRIFGRGILGTAIDPENLMAK
ncbi:MAG: hypothetical protein ACI9OO_001455 [Bacteroidia bacterium]|jgi:hypothetical protein